MSTVTNGGCADHSRHLDDTCLERARGSRAVRSRALGQCAISQPEIVSIDLKELVDRLQLRGISLPVLIRFTDILGTAWATSTRLPGAIAQHQVPGPLQLRLPDQGEPAAAGRRRVLSSASPINFGLEAGSKPELLAVVAIADNDDADHLQRVQGRRVHRDGDAGQKIGRNIIPVVEKYTELGLIVEAEKVGVRPQIGMRVKLAARGAAGGSRRAATGRSSASPSPDHPRARGAEGAACRTASSSSTSTLAARSPTSAS